MLRLGLKFVLPLALLAMMVGLIVVASQGASMPLIDTKGVIADSQRDTLYLAVAIMSVIVVPVFLLTFFVAIKYRESNKKAVYKPEWASSKLLETIWWGVPLVIVAVLSVVVWKTSHSLDPYRAIESNKPAMQVQVVALQWKWLFIYPGKNAASVNELVMPVGRPVTFTITSDAPMNSFWIPQLGGQIYAMSGMSTTLNLQADSPGMYRGVSANLSGEGHSEMDFKVKAVSDAELDRWLARASKSDSELSQTVYEQLRLPSRRNETQLYSMTAPNNLYDSIITRYSGGHMHGGNNMGGKAD